MSYKAALINNIYFVRWQEPESGDANRIYREVSQAEKRAGRKLIYIAVSPDGSPPPNKEAREEFIQIFDHLRKHCISVHIVQEAKGFKAAIKRSALAGMLLANWRYSNVKVHKSQEEAFATLTDVVDIDWLKQRIKELGLHR